MIQNVRKAVCLFLFPLWSLRCPDSLSNVLISAHLWQHYRSTLWETHISQGCSTSLHLLLERAGWTSPRPQMCTSGLLLTLPCEDAPWRWGWQQAHKYLHDAFVIFFFFPLFLPFNLVAVVCRTNQRIVPKFITVPRAFKRWNIVYWLNYRSYLWLLSSYINHLLSMTLKRKIQLSPSLTR